MGDADEVLKKAKKDFEKGEYQVVAEVTNMIVFETRITRKQETFVPTL